MFTSTQWQAWRPFALYTLVFNVMGGVSLGIQLLFGFNTTTLSDAFLGQSIQLLEQAHPAQYPLWSGIIIISLLPFFMAGLLVVARATLFIPDDYLIMRGITYVCGFVISGLAIFLMISLLNAALFAESQAEIRLWLRAYTLGIYLDIWVTILHFASFGWLQYRLKVFPRWLALSSVVIALIAGMVNFFVPNTDLPSFVLALTLPIVMPETLIWSVFLLLATSRAALDPAATSPGL